MTRSGCLRNRADPGAIANCAPACAGVLAAWPGPRAADVATAGRRAAPVWMASQSARRRGRSSRSRVEAARCAAGLAQLGDEVLPLADPQVVQVLGLAHPAEGAVTTAPAARLKVAPELEEAAKSECSSANRAWAASAGLLLSTGRSRGSWMDSAATTTSTSRMQPSRPASMHHPAEPRVEGSRASGGPSWVRRVCRRSAVAAERAELLAAGRRRRRRGAGRAGRRTGSASTSPSPSAVICRMTEARLVRRISGSVNSGRGLEVLLASRAGCRRRRRRARTGRRAGGRWPG